MPFHLGHLYCIDTAAKECDRVCVILFVNGADEQRIMRALPPGIDFSDREECVRAACAKYDNVRIAVIDVANCRTPDGQEDWDAETPLVINECGKFDAVYSSEISYDEYFKRAYPFAEHRLVDPPRIVYPISGTMIRDMEINGMIQEAKRWRI